MKHDRFSWFLAGSFFGTVFSFLYDPSRGNYRRALVHDKLFSYQRHARIYFARILRDLGNRATGLKVEFQKLGRYESVPDNVLAARVRSEMGRIISHPRAIYVLAKDGVVTLSGLILKKEVNRLLGCAERVCGVKRVINELEVHETAGKIPSLQGAGPAYLVA